MDLAAWLRFAELSLLALWVGARSCWPRAALSWRDSALLAGAAGLALLQAGAEAQSLSDPFTSAWQMLGPLLVSAYGALTMLAVLLAAMLAYFIWQVAHAGEPGLASAWGRQGLVGGLGVLLLSCGAAATAGPAARAAAATGEIVMTRTLSVPRSSLTIKNPYLGDNQSAARGEVIYRQNCAVCHGVVGNGDGPAARSLRIRPASFRGNPQHYLAPGMDGPHFWVIQHGDGRPDGMPAWQGKLSDQQMWDVLNYVKRLASPGAPLPRSADAPSTINETTSTSSTTSSRSSAGNPPCAPPTGLGGEGATVSPTAQSGGLCVTYAINPGRLGPEIKQQQVVALTTPAGVPVSDAQVALLQDMPVHDMGPEEQPMAATSDGRYTLTNSIFTMEGDWHMQVIVRHGGATNRVMFHALADRANRLWFSSHPGETADLGPSPGLDLRGPPTATLSLSAGRALVEVYPELVTDVGRQAADVQLLDRAGQPLVTDSLRVAVEGAAEVTALPAGPGRFLADLGTAFHQGWRWRLTMRAATASGEQTATMWLVGQPQERYRALRLGG